jgi:hypothetical protein
MYRIIINVEDKYFYVQGTHCLCSNSTVVVHYFTKILNWVLSRGGGPQTRCKHSGLGSLCPGIGVRQQSVCSKSLQILMIGA